MKKCLIIYICIAVAFFTACNRLETIEKTKNYAITFDSEKNIYTCEIFDNNETRLYSANYTANPPSVTNISEDILELKNSYGTGMYSCIYFDLEAGAISQEYEAVQAVSDTMVARAAIIDDELLLIISGLFDDSINKTYFFGKCYTFNPGDSFIKVEFIPQYDLLSVIYLSGSDYMPECALLSYIEQD